MLPMLNRAQGGTWVWMAGPNTYNEPPVYGIPGVPSTTNNPPATYESANWVDLQGNFWVYGGFSPSNNVFGIEAPYCALWKFDPVALTWTWVKGPDTTNQYPVYGTQGVPAPNNTPGSRSYGTITWTDSQGALWLYGGINGEGVGEDLWKYDIGTNEWTWMSGSDFADETPVYGTRTVASDSSIPG